MTDNTQTELLSTSIILKLISRFFQESPFIAIIIAEIVGFPIAGGVILSEHYNLQSECSNLWNWCLGMICLSGLILPALILKFIEYYAQHTARCQSGDLESNESADLRLRAEKYYAMERRVEGLFNLYTWLIYMAKAGMYIWGIVIYINIASSCRDSYADHKLWTLFLTIFWYHTCYPIIACFMGTIGCCLSFSYLSHSHC